MVTRFFNREQLYKEVWQNTFTTLSKQYSLDATSIRKTCERLHIPFPPIGYWSKVAFGKSIKIPELPEWPCCKLKRKRQIKLKQLPFLLAIKTEPTTPKIEVKKTLHNPHPLIVKTQKTLQSIRTDEYGMKKVTKDGIDIRVSPANANRALRIMDAILRWFEKNHIRVELSSSSSSTYVYLLDERIAFGIEEKSTVTKKIPKQWGSFTFYDREYTPTNKLSLVIKEYCWDNIRKVWSDGKRNQLEDILNQFIDGLYAFAEYERARTIKKKLENEAHEKARLERKYQLRCQELENEMLNKLEKQVHDWSFSQQLTQYIRAVEEKAKKTYAEEPYPKELSSWIEWANDRANQLNPLEKSLPSYKSPHEQININNLD